MSEARIQITDEAHAADTLLGILKEHVEVCDQWEDHLSAAMGGRITLAEEKEQHKWLRENCTRPLIARCDEAGFKYSDLRAIIPGAFKTTIKERGKLLWDLHRWADNEYDLIPF